MSERHAGADVVVERSVAAPPDVVWNLISDVTRMGEWSPETTSARWVKGADGPAMGARFKGSNQVGSRKWSTQCVVTECEPGRRFGFVPKAGPIRFAEWRYEIVPEGDGCRVIESWTDKRNWLGKQLGKPVSGVSDRATHNRGTMEVTLERLAAAAESTLSP